MERYSIEDTILVEAVTLDYLYNNSAFPNIDFIKIDVQGAALDVLQGGMDCLKENTLGIEVSNFSVSTAIKFSLRFKPQFAIGPNSIFKP